MSSASPPPDERARWWRRQVVETANSVDFYANLQTGVLTLTTYAELASDPVEEDPRPEPEPVVVSSPTETVTWTYTESPTAYWDSVTHVLDATLAQALAHFTTRLG